MLVRKMVNISCGECGIVFGVPDDWYLNRTRKHTGWYCPNGHCRAFKSESDIDKAQRLANEAQAQANQEQHLRLVAERARNKAIAEKKRLEKRVAHGVCLCCNRTFINLQRHMKTKHAQEMLLPGSEKRIEGPVKVA